MYCRDDECNRWHRLKKQVIDYRSFLSSPPPSCSRPFAVTIIFVSACLLFSNATLEDHLRVPLYRVRDIKRRDTMPRGSGTVLQTKRIHFTMCATRPCNVPPLSLIDFSLSLCLTRHKHPIAPDSRSRYVIRENEPSGALAALTVSAIRYLRKGRDCKITLSKRDVSGRSDTDQSAVLSLRD